MSEKQYRNIHKNTKGFLKYEHNINLMENVF